MSAETELNTIERIIEGNPHFFYKSWRAEIEKRAGTVRKEIAQLRRFAMLKPGYVQEVVLSKAAFLEDRLADLLSNLKG